MDWASWEGRKNLLWQLFFDNFFLWDLSYGSLLSRLFESNLRVQVWVVIALLHKLDRRPPLFSLVDQLRILFQSLCSLIWHFHWIAQLIGILKCVLHGLILYIFDLRHLLRSVQLWLWEDTCTSWLNLSLKAHPLWSYLLVKAIDCTKLPHGWIVSLQGIWTILNYLAVRLVTLRSVCNHV